MATYYVKTVANGGSDVAAGTSAATAWATFGKLLGASGMASGDQAWIAPGVYRETVSVAMASATVETKIYGDVDGSHFTGIAGGEIQLTAYTTNDTTAPSATTLLDLNGKSFLTFKNIVFITGTSNTITATTASSTDISFVNCLITSPANAATMSITAAANTVLNWVIDSCIILKLNTASSISVTLTRPTGADFNVNMVIKNCMFIGMSGNALFVTATGANLFKAGGVSIYNCTNFGASLLQVGSANNSTSIPCNVYNCMSFSGNAVCVNANTSGQIVEDYNNLYSTTPRTNVTAGAHSITGNTYAPLFFAGHEYSSIGSNLKPFGMPKVGSPLLNFGNQASSPTVDILGVTRPVATVLPSVGCYELGQGAVKETTTIRTGSNAIKIAAAGYQDFDLPVNAVSTTITIYAQYDGAYAGTLPSMNIVNGTECGVAAATATQVGAASTWEQLSLNFTPTSSGIITVRLISSSTAPTGNAFFDDSDVT